MIVERKGEREGEEKMRSKQRRREREGERKVIYDEMRIRMSLDFSRTIPDV